MAKIDYVVPMVFPEDREWHDSLMRTCDIYSENYARFRSWETEELLVRLVRKNMPFVRDVIILLASESQRQPWMDCAKVVYHKDFIPGEFLPTFNSRGIEMFLHRIPGLSEYFLYGNDDMYPLSPLKEEDFFVEGRPCIVMHEKDFPVNPNNFQRACMSGLNFVAREFGKKFTDKWYKNGHSIAPVKLSTIRHLWEIGEQDILNSVSPIRNARNFNQYIYSWWHYLSGEYVEHAPKRKYVAIDKGEDEVLAALREGGIVCVNDRNSVYDITDLKEKVKTVLNQYLA